MIDRSDIETDYDPKPIPTDAFDWEAWHPDFELTGYGPTKEDAVRDLIDKIKEREDV